jgi:hypothetical protein
MITLRPTIIQVDGLPRSSTNRDVEVIILPKVLISGEGAHIIKVSIFGDVEHLFPCRRGDRMRLAMSAIGP